MSYLCVLPFVWWAKFQFPRTPIQSLPNLLAALIAVQLLWELLTRDRPLPFGRPLFLAIAMLALIVVVQSRNPLATQVHTGTRGAEVYLGPMLLFFAGLAFWAERDAVATFFKVGVATGGLVALYALKQLVTGPTAAEQRYFVARFGRTLAEHKLFGTFSGPDVFAFASAFFVLLCVCSRLAGVWPRLSLAVAATNAFLAVACGTRIAIGGLLVAGTFVVVLALADPRTAAAAFRLLVIGLASALVLLTVVIATPVTYRDRAITASNPVQAAVIKLALLKRGRADTDVAFRIERGAKFSHFIARHPLGTGPGIVGLVSSVEAPTSGVVLPSYLRDEPWIFQHDFVYFSIGVELGLPALALFVVILFGGASFAVRVRRRMTDPTTRALLMLAGATPILALVVGLTNESFRLPEEAGYVWLMVAAPFGIALQRGLGRRASDVSDEPGRPSGRRAAVSGDARSAAPS